MTRGNGWFSRFLGKLKPIFKSDAIGAATGMIGGAVGGWNGVLIGGIVGAVSASVKSAVGETPKTTVTTETKPEDTATDDATIAKMIAASGFATDSEAYTIGYFHNIIIANLFEKYPDLMEMESDQILELIYQETTIATGYDAKSIMSENIEFKRVLEEIPLSGNVDAYFLSVYPELESTFSVIELYSESMSKLDEVELKVDYSNGFVQFIENSDLSSSQKAVIKSGLATGLASSVLWKAAE